MTREEAIWTLSITRALQESNNTLSEALEMAIEALRQQAERDWIPCSILPQEKDLSVDGMVLVQEKDTQRIFKGWYENIEGDIHWFDEMGFSMDAVMWRRLPEPYKGVE